MRDALARNGNPPLEFRVEPRTVIATIRRSAAKNPPKFMESAFATGVNCSTAYLLVFQFYQIKVSIFIQLIYGPTEIVGQ